MNKWHVTLFLILLFASYGGMHYFLYRKLRWIFLNRKKHLILIVSVVAVFMLAIQFLVGSGMLPQLAPLLWLPSIWLGFVFLFLVIAGSIDVLLWMLSLVHKDNLLIRIKQKTRSLMTGAITFAICVLGILSASQVTLHTQTLNSPKLRQAMTVVQITDLHLNMLSHRQALEDLVSRINALHPDIVVSTGDLVDMQSQHLDGLSQTLASIKATMGKYAIYGNHEAIAGAEQSRAFIERSGFVLLSNQGIHLNNIISVVGVDDPAMQSRLKLSTDDRVEETLLSDFSPLGFTLLLKHQPVVSPRSRGLFDLQLSGHTHAGQIFPFGLMVKLVYSAPQGLSRVTPDSWLYVSNGTGTWGPPMRVLAEPEISVFYLRPATGKEGSY